MTPLVAAALVSAGPSTLAALLSYRAVVHGRDNKAALTQVNKKAELNRESLQRVEKSTNGVLTSRIREVLRDELIRHAATTKEMQELLDLILRNVQGEETDTP